MSISQNFLPSDAIVEGKSFYGHDTTQLDATETRLYEYMKSFASILLTQGMDFSREELRSIQTASALIDALAKTRFDLSNPHFPVLESGHHAFNVFYRASDSDVWKLQFANASYLEKIGSNLRGKLQSPESDLMWQLYQQETIEKYNAAAKDSKGWWYTSQFIEMDKVVISEYKDEWGDTILIKPAFFWYRKEFDHPDGGKIQVRIGMNGTGLLPEQKTELASVYKLADALRAQDMTLVHYSSTPYEPLISQIKEKLAGILASGKEQDRNLTVPLGWMRMILEIADDIVRNSPFPLTIVDEKGKIEQISPAYAATVGYNVNDILKPDFFSRIYPGAEGETVGSNIVYYKQHGNYPPGESFFVSRGKRFSVEETASGLQIGVSEEIVPSLYPIGQKITGGVFTDEGTIRLNTVRPIEESLRALVSDSWPGTCHLAASDDGTSETDLWTESNVGGLNAWLNDFNSKP